jgi:ATP-dependent Clp protease ATP-binding subunit ClpB
VPVLQKLGAQPETLRGQVEADLDLRPRVGGASADPVVSRELTRVFDRALRDHEGIRRRVRLGRALPARARRQGRGWRRAAAHRRRRQPRRAPARAQGVRGSTRITDPNPEDKYQALKRYTRDLTDLARQGKIDPVIGRDEEIRRVIQVFSRRTKNNPS